MCVILFLLFFIPLCLCSPLLARPFFPSPDHCLVNTCACILSHAWWTPMASANCLVRLTKDQTHRHTHTQQIQTHTHILSHTHTHILSLSPSHTHTHTHTHIHTHTHTHSHTHSLSLSLSLTHKHNVYTGPGFASLLVAHT